MPNNKCCPNNGPKGSRLVSEFKAYNKWTLLGKCFGGLCMPCCCIGLACWTPAKAVECELSPLKRVIDKYTPQLLDKLRIAVDREESLFLRACLNVNNETTTTSIYPNITLLDAICASEEHTKNVICKFRLPKIFQDNQDRLNYEKQVYSEYIKIGGNPAIVIYGLPEYLCIIYDPTSLQALSYFKGIGGSTQLSAFVQTYKQASGF